jgi:hypothetical protein
MSRHHTTGRAQLLLEWNLPPPVPPARFRFQLSAFPSAPSTLNLQQGKRLRRSKKGCSNRINPPARLFWKRLAREQRRPRCWPGNCGPCCESWISFHFHLHRFGPIGGLPADGQPPPISAFSFQYFSFPPFVPSSRRPISAFCFPDFSFCPPSPTGPFPVSAFSFQLPAAPKPREGGSAFSISAFPVSAFVPSFPARRNRINR